MTFRKTWIAIILFVVAGGVYAAYRVARPFEGDGSVIRVSGNIELTEVAIGFPAPGRLVDVPVNEGDSVHRGDVIARLDTDELAGQLERAQASLAAARSGLRQLEAAVALRNEQVAGETMRAQAEVDRFVAMLDELRGGARPQELDAAEASVSSAEGEFSRTARDWDRAQTLYADEDISTAEFDEFRSRYEVASARLAEVRERLALVREGPRREDLRRAEAEVASARANLRLAEAGRFEIVRMREELDGRRAEIRRAEAEVAIAESRLTDAVASSPIEGIVLVKAAEAGEVLGAGAPVLTVGDLSRPWLRAYINETDLGRVRLGTEVTVRTDSFPGKTYSGRVSFIASEAEFTPNEIQTAEERVRLVYRIKVDIENPEGELKSNMPADAEIPVLQAR